jgi:hypothetical protein
MKDSADSVNNNFWSSLRLPFNDSNGSDYPPVIDKDSSTLKHDHEDDDARMERQQQDEDEQSYFFDCDTSTNGHAGDHLQQDDESPDDDDESPGDEDDSDGDEDDSSVDAGDDDDDGLVEGDVNNAVESSSWYGSETDQTTTKNVDGDVANKLANVQRAGRGTQQGLAAATNNSTINAAVNAAAQ